MFSLLPSLAQANIDAFEFSNEELRNRYQHLAFILRCPKCQNQNIIDSNAPIASDLRIQVHRLLHEGFDDEQIIDFMVARYGDFVLYEPPVNRLTYLLWYGPVILVMIGLLVVVIMIRNRKQQANADEAMDSQSRERLNQVLKQKTVNSSGKKKSRR
ncbi:cytochrome c-type biogenesis protein CcmH [Oceanospirillum multiglobuliferum]|uniref:Cytochrome c-type biogenesis protein n=2 Tax=Oceanospirillum multiglobuliferum TaxID=64969 RepID=A0A1V4TA17_9GAMM|nr:cytochrome c-type biogenesis protein CcmH [Oceanospirillum multiglobuliferum]